MAREGTAGGGDGRGGDGRRGGQQEGGRQGRGRRGRGHVEKTTEACEYTEEKRKTKRRPHSLVENVADSHSKHTVYPRTTETTQVCSCTEFAYTACVHKQVLILQRLCAVCKSIAKKSGQQDIADPCCQVQVLLELYFIQYNTVFNLVI